MLRQLLSSHDNGQSMVIYPSSIHAPSGMTRSEHAPFVVVGDTFLGIMLRQLYRLMTTVRAW